MDKQTTLAFVLIGAVLIIWLYFNSPEQQYTQPVASKGDSTLVKKDTSKQKTAPQQQQAQTVQTAPQDTTDLGRALAQQAQEQIITIDNELVRLEMTSKGGRIRRWFLKKYETWYHDKPTAEGNFYKEHINLINSESGDFDLTFFSKTGKAINTAAAPFQADLKEHNYEIKGSDSLVINYTLKVNEQSSIVKRYVFRGSDYATRCDIKMVNMQNIISNYRYDVVWSNGINFVEQNSYDEATYSNASVYSGDEQAVINVKKDEPASKDINGKIDWLGIRNKYFAVIIAPLTPYSNGSAYIGGVEKAFPDNGLKKIYNASLKVPFNDQPLQSSSFLIYMGPVDYNVLKTYGRSFEKIVDFGSLFGLRIIIRPISEYILLPLFKFLHLFIPNYGLVIIVFSLIIKFALYPLTKSSFKSMKKMQQLQPMIAELKEKHKDDPQRVSKETMKLYSTYGINPAGGCLPMLLQMPILVALWGLFNVAVELRHQPFWLWIDNLSSPDVIMTLPFSIPLFGISQISGLALLLGITMFLQQKMTVTDPSQKALVYMMPVMFTLMFMGFPSGLNLYYFMFNLFSIIQQYWVNHYSKAEPLVPVTNPKKGSGFMQRMMEAAEKSAAQQKAGQAKGKKK